MRKHAGTPPVRRGGIDGETGLFVERGAAVFKNVRLRELAVTVLA